MTLKEHNTMLSNLDMELSLTVAASKRACENAKQAIGKACGKTLASALKGRKTNGTH